MDDTAGETIYDADVSGNSLGHVQSALCTDANDPTTYRLGLFMWSTSHVPPGNFPDIFNLGASVQQISPTVFKWSS